MTALLSIIPESAKLSGIIGRVTVELFTNTAHSGVTINLAVCTLMKDISPDDAILGKRVDCRNRVEWDELRYRSSNWEVKNRERRNRERGGEEDGEHGSACVKNYDV